MPGHANVSGTWKAPTWSAKVSSAWKTLVAGYVKVSGVWEPFLSALSATLSPTSISQSVANGSVNLFNSCTCTPADNIGTVSYSWVRVSGSANITALSPSSQTTGFNSVGTNEVNSATFKCVVTDDLGSADSDTVFIQATHGSPS